MPNSKDRNFHFTVHHHMIVKAIPLNIEFQNIELSVFSFLYLVASRSWNDLQGKQEMESDKAHITYPNTAAPEPYPLSFLSTAKILCAENIPSWAQPGSSSLFQMASSLIPRSTSASTAPFGLVFCFFAISNCLPQPCFVGDCFLLRAAQKLLSQTKNYR